MKGHARRALVCFMAFIAASALTPTATGQTPVAPELAARELRATELYDEARRHFDAGEHHAALGAIDGSLASLASPNSELLRAHVLRSLERRVDAMKAYQATMAGAKQRLLGGESRFEATVAEAGRWIGVLGASLGEIQVAVIGSTPAVTLSAAGAPVRLDRHDDGDATAILWLEPGSVMPLEVADATTRRSQVVTGEAGTPRRVVFDLGAKPKPLVPKGPEPQLSSSGGLPTGTWIAGGIGVAGLTGFAVLGGLALSVDAELEQSCSPSCSGSRVDDAERGERFQVAANVSAAVAGVGLATAAVFWILQATETGGAASFKARGTAGEGSVSASNVQVRFY